MTVSPLPWKSLKLIVGSRSCRRFLAAGRATLGHQFCHRAHDLGVHRRNRSPRIHHDHSLTLSLRNGAVGCLDPSKECLALAFESVLIPTVGARGYIAPPRTRHA